MSLDIEGSWMDMPTCSMASTFQSLMRIRVLPGKMPALAAGLNIAT